MLGIPNYEPNFVSKVDTFVRIHRDQLIDTIGSTFDDYWLMWHTLENKWYNDGPVVLRISNKQFEFTAYQLDEFSLTFDQIDLSQKLDWYGAGDETPLKWRSRGNSQINKLLGRKITDINLIAYNFISTVIADNVNPQNVGQRGETGFMLHGIEFTFKKKGWLEKNNYLQIFNALDSNGLATKKQKETKQYRKISLK